MKHLAWFLFVPFLLTACKEPPPPFCGDGIVNLDEACDDGNDQNGDGCEADCSLSPTAAIQIAAGGAHTCALLDTGAVRCWGDGSFGQLGYGNSEIIGDDETPASAGNVDVGGTVTQIASGALHTCALLDTGAVRCWGRGFFGQLGYGNTENIGDDETPASVGDVDLGGTAVQIAAGVNHTCALLDTGNVRCWGNGVALGYGNFETIGDDEVPASAGDVNVGGIVEKITAGDHHTCALLDTGAVRCWGSGFFGQLGYGNTRTVGVSEDPASAGDVDLGGSAKEISAGQFHTCAVLDTGAVRCWGLGDLGQLGYGNTEIIGDNEVPASAGDVNVGGTVVQISAGGVHTCALLDTGSVRCWGSGSLGQIGYGNTNPRIGDNEVPASAGDVNVGGNVEQIVAGGFHTCALLDAGNVRCWGQGELGQLGYGNTERVGNNETPSQAGDVNVGGTVVQLSGGLNHTCALLDTGNVRCWGVGISGQLGYGNSETIGDDEVPASAGDVNVGGTVVQIASGFTHNCALLDTGNVRCWGVGINGQLGYGNPETIGDDETPASAGDVNVGGTVVQITAGGFHTCALLDTGSVRCWGEGIFLGYGSLEDIGDDEVPASAGDVNVGGTVVQISANENHTCALLDTGNVRCWGSSSFGQLGYGNTETIGDDEVPASAGDVNVGGRVTAISAGANHTCALLDTGSIRCWGQGGFGELGYGNTENIGDDEVPASVGDVNVGGRVTQITGGYNHTCALLDTGAVRCWGNGDKGALGYADADDIIGDSEAPATAGDVPFL